MVLNFNDFGVDEQTRRSVLRSEQRIVHHDGVVFGDEFFVGHAVDEAGGAFPDAVVAGVTAPWLHLDEVVGLKNFVFIFERTAGEKFAVEVFVIDPEVDLKGVFRIISEL